MSEPAGAPRQPAPWDCWYAAYGSNLDPDYLARYIPGAPVVAQRPGSWMTLDGYARVFAGHSRRWGGGVAFLRPATSESVQVRLYPVTWAEFTVVVAAENLLGHLSLELSDLTTASTPVPGADPAFRSDDRAGKYDIVLRLPDHHGLPVVTLTTSRDLPRVSPSPDYLGVIHDALASAPR